MAKWDIDPPGVSSVVSRTGQRAAGFAANKAAPIDAVGQPTARILAGAVEASTAYVEGDLEMAATAQANATANATANAVGG